MQALIPSWQVLFPGVMHVEEGAGGIWQFHLDALLMAAGFLAVYVVGLRWASRWKLPDETVTRKQIIWYVSGVAVLWIGAGTPIHVIGERYLFSVHMTQHMLFSLIAPVMMLLGTPAWLLRPFLQKPAVAAVARLLTRAFPAFILYNLFIIATHFPDVVDFALEHHTAHFWLHVVLVATATLTWWPVLSPTPELPRLSPGSQLVYLFFHSLTPAVVASFLALSPGAMYRFYELAPVRYWGIGVVDDQQIAGLIMKLGGTAVLWFIMTVIFFRWFSSEDRRQAAQLHRPDARVEWPEVEAELQRMGLTNQRTS